MRERLTRIIFNRYAVPTVADPDNHFYADDPIIQLDAIPFKADMQPRRTNRQLALLPTQSLPFPDPLFGESLAWPYCGYIVQRLTPPIPSPDAAADDQRFPRAQPPGITPERPVDYQTRLEQLADLQSAASADALANVPPRDAEAPLTICLFNVIVALEWRPEARFLRRLAWAFRRASDFLYDVTDGAMIFGQVIFGGPEWMAGADIQIMASNRLHPRSWVNGLHMETKYQPIRLGRGAWSKRNRISIPWDEPEGYRAIVHEWAHYALGLKDEYLRTLSEPGLVIPSISLATDSIMATLEGVSELIVLSGPERKRREWHMLATKDVFSFLKLDRDHELLDGPGRLPLPLPHFHNLISRPRDTRSKESTTSAAELILRVPEGIDAEHCWVYVIQGDLDHPKQIIAQGTIDARAVNDGFRLFGASQGDTIVLMGAARGRFVVRCRTIDAAFQQAAAPGPIEAWGIDATPNDFPTIDVAPVPLRQNDQLSRINVRAAPGLYPLWAFPWGQSQARKITSPEEYIDIATLDGHVLVSWKEDGKQKLTICSYSQGGGPLTSNPGAPPPITGGSAEGNVMIFFEPRDTGEGYSDTRIVTTTLYSAPKQLPDRLRHNGARARSYAFSLASTGPLPAELKPTLVMYYDGFATHDGDLRIYRQAGEEAWQALPTTVPPGAAFAAAPLNTDTAPGLFSATPGSERYRLYLLPRGDDDLEAPNG